MQQHFIISLASQGRETKYYTINLEKKNFVSQEINLFGDGLPEFDEYALSFSGQHKVDFWIKAFPTNPDSVCEVIPLTKSGTRSTFHLKADLEIDSSDECVVLVGYHKGGFAKIRFILQGT